MTYLLLTDLPPSDHDRFVTTLVRLCARLMQISHHQPSTSAANAQLSLMKTLSRNFDEGCIKMVTEEILKAALQSLPPFSSPPDSPVARGMACEFHQEMLNLLTVSMLNADYDEVRPINLYGIDIFGEFSSTSAWRWC